jgi:hypothetical protein
MEAARRSWILISKDQNIRRNRVEREVYEAAALRGFIVTGKDMSGKELAELLVACLPRMVRKMTGRTGPSLYTISRSGVFAELI